MSLRFSGPRLARLASEGLSRTKHIQFHTQIKRFISSNEKPLPKNDKPRSGPNQDQLPHVSEEAAVTSKILGEQPPEIEQGTPVQEVLKRDPSAKEKAPEVLKEKSSASSPNGSRAYSTSTRSQLELRSASEPIDISLDMSSLGHALGRIEAEQATSGQIGDGYKFGLPALPIGTYDHLKYRYDPVIHQVTMLLMRDGKLAQAQSNMARILNYLRTAKPPKSIDTGSKDWQQKKAILVPDAPPLSHLPLNPIVYLTLALDSVAPLLKIRSLKGIAGGGQSLQIPTPLAVRQRRRQAVIWILETIEKKTGKGSGRGMFAQKFAEEIIAIVEGKSSVWEKRTSVHRLGTNARANMAKVEQRQRQRKR